MIRSRTIRLPSGPVTDWFLVCDECGAASLFCTGADGAEAVDEATEAGWNVHGGRHYCPRCERMRKGNA